MKFWITLSPVLFLLFFGCSDKPPSSIGRVVNSTGKHSIGGKYISELEVSKQKDGELRLWIASSEQPSQHSTDKALNLGWFAFPETEGRLWVCYGADDLQLLEYSDVDGGVVCTDREYDDRDVPQYVRSLIEKNVNQ